MACLVFPLPQVDQSSWFRNTYMYLTILGVIVDSETRLLEK